MNAVRILVPAAAAAALMLAGCGADTGEPAAKTAPQSATPTAVPTTSVPAAAATVPTTTAPTATTAPPATTTTASPPSGGGDEEAIRVPADFQLSAKALSPATITVPAFLAVEITVRSAGGSGRVVLATPGGTSLDVPAGGAASVRLPGLKPGRYALTGPGGATATLVVGGDAGP